MQLVAVVVQTLERTGRIFAPASILVRDKLFERLVFEYSV